MLCRVEMPNSEQAFGRFYRWRLLNLRGMGGGKFVLIILPLLLAAFTAYLWFSGASVVLGLVVLAASLAFTIFSMYVRPNSEFRKQPGAALQTIVYIFTDTGFTRSVRSEEGGMPDNLSSQYSVLTRVVETKSDFYLFYAPTRAYVVDKEFFTNGTVEELSAFLKSKMGKDKFKG